MAVKVLMVCMGNICRSPLAHGFFQHLVESEGLAEVIQVDSAGTHAYHVGEQPDPRSQQTAMSHGIDLSSQRARKVSAADFAEFDYVLAMDHDNLASLEAICPSQHRERLRLFLDYAPQRQESEVPDPYYGGQSGFERVFDMVEDASRGLLRTIRETHLSKQ